MIEPRTRQPTSDGRPLERPEHRTGLAVLSAAGWVWLLAAVPVQAADWQPIDPAELKMTSEPQAPAAPAIYLYRQYDRDDNGPDFVEYVRIKILTEEGRKYANVELEYDKQGESIRDIRARTIHPDGTITDFDGQVFEKPIVKGKGVKVMAKSFTLPGADVGSIIEYRYHKYLRTGYVFDSHWTLDTDLYTKHAKFSLQPYSEFTLTWSWPKGLPPGTEAPKSVHDIIRLETRDVPAFVEEDHSPPENQLKYRVEFVYTESELAQKEPAKFWKGFCKREYSEIDDFIDERRAMQEALAGIVQAVDDPETKLHKIYDRVQQLRNVDWDRDKSAEELKREKQKDASDVGDVWKNGYGTTRDLTWLFLALARAAGLEADPVYVSTRDQFFFSPAFMNAWQLNSPTVVVKLDGKNRFFSPATPFAPFGLLPWPETGVNALKVTKDGGEWLVTTMPDAAESRIERTVNLKLAPDGTLEGKATVRYSGLEALWRRLQERHEDDTDRKLFLEDDIQGDIPTGIHAKLTNSPDWSSSSPTLTAEYDLEVPGWAANAGRKLLLAVGIFGNEDKHTFEHAERLHPIYFTFPYQRSDFVTIELPQGWQAVSTPDPRSTDLGAVTYNLVSQASGSTLHVNRKVRIGLALAEVKHYTALRNFFQTVRTGDEEQIVLAQKPR